MKLYEETIVINNNELSYYDNKLEAPQTLIFLHGWGADKNNLFSIYEPLLNSYRVITPDLPGFGSSIRPSVTVGSEYYADVIYALISKLSLPNVSIIGHSFGGKIGIILSTKHLDLVRNLVLINSSGLKPRRNPIWYIKVYSYKIMKFIITKVIRNNQLLESLKSGYGSDDYRNAGQMRDILVKTVNEDHTDKLKLINCPVFIYWGDKDTATPVWMAHKMHKLIRNSGIFIVKGGGHFSFIDDNRITAIIKELIK